MDKQTASGQASGFRAPPITQREQNAIVGGVMLAMLLAALDQTIVAPAMPTIGSSLGHAEYLPWIVTAYLLTSTATSPLYGKVSDVYGRRLTIFGAILVFVAGSVVSALAGNMFVLIVGRAIQGLGGGGLFALTQIVIGDLVPPRERGKFAAWISGTWAIASVAGPTLGGYFAEHLHWSLIFWINLPLGLLAVVIMNRPLGKLAIEKREQRFDLLGSFLLIVATAALLLALNWGGATFAWDSAPILALLAAALVLAVLLGWRLVKADEPLISIEILRNSIVLASCSAMFLVQGAYVGLTVFIPIYLQQGLGSSVSASGTELLGMLLGTVAGAWVSGRLLLHLTRYKWLAILGSGLATASLVLFAVVAGQKSLLLSEIAMIGAGIGAGLTFPVAIIATQNAVARADLGAATGVLTFLRALGGAIGVASLGAIALGYGIPMAHEGAQAAADADVSAGVFAVVFIAAAVWMAGSFLSFLVMREKPLQGRE